MLSDGAPSTALWGALCGLAYTVIGFRIMKEGSMALFTLFLMSGGMLVPAVWGWLFLHEKPVPLHLLREKKRGYNQALLLANALGRYTGIPVRGDLFIISEYHSARS